MIKSLQRKNFKKTVTILVDKAKDQKYTLSQVKYYCFFVSLNSPLVFFTFREPDQYVN